MNKEELKHVTKSMLDEQGEIAAATYLAEKLFAEKTDIGGSPYIGHLRRVANDVPLVLRPAAWMHDLVEDIEGWKYEDLTDIGFSPTTLNAIRAVTKMSETEPYFHAIERVGSMPEAIPLKRADLRDNANLLRLAHKPLAADFERVTKYFLSDKYLESIESGRTTPGTPFAQWHATQPETVQDKALVAKETNIMNNI